MHRHVGARGHAQACGLVHLAARIPLMPHRGREARRESLRSVAASVGERDRLGQNAKPGALGRLLRRCDRAHRADERRPRENFSHVRERSHAIGIVKIEQCRLREDIGRAEARGMRRDCLRFLSGVLRGFRRARPSRGRRASSRSHRRAACPGRRFRAGARTEESARAAGACSRPCPRGQATPPSISETRAARPHRTVSGSRDANSSPTSSSRLAPCCSSSVRQNSGALRPALSSVEGLHR